MHLNSYVSDPCLVSMLIPICTQFYYAQWDPHMQIFQQSVPVCIRGSPYAYGDPHVQNYAYGDTKLNFLYAHNFIMHTGIPVCIWGLVSIRSPYAYRDRENPRMHTGITY